MGEKKSKKMGKEMGGGGGADTLPGDRQVIHSRLYRGTKAPRAS